MAEEPEIPEKRPDISTENIHFGESRESPYYDECLNCCFCDRAVPRTWKQWKEKKELDEKGEGEPDGDEDWQEEVVRRVTEKGTYGYEGVHHLDYRQFLHVSCLSILTYKERQELAKRNRNNIYVPSQLDDYGVNCNLDYRNLVAAPSRFSPNPTPTNPLIWKVDPFTLKHILTYDENGECLHEKPFAKKPVLWRRCPVTGTLVRVYDKTNQCDESSTKIHHKSAYCARCDIVLNQERPGMAYPQGGDVKYIHFFCYREVMDVRAQAIAEAQALASATK